MPDISVTASLPAPSTSLPISNSISDSSTSVCSFLFTPRSISLLQLINIQRWKLNYIVNRTMLIMINSENKKRGKAWKCENEKDSFRLTWCNCWFKDGCSLWMWIASFILSLKPVEAWSKTWKFSAEHKARQCAESSRYLKCEGPYHWLSAL